MKSVGKTDKIWKLSENTVKSENSCNNHKIWKLEGKTVKFEKWGKPVKYEKCWENLLNLKNGGKHRQNMKIGEKNR